MIRQWDAQQACDKLLKKHGTEGDFGPNLDRWQSLWFQGWRTNFAKSGEWCARCYHDEKRIVISLMYLNSTSQVELEKTLLHEIAHALVGPGKGHGQEWIDKAKSIGLNDPKSCVTGEINIDAGRAMQPSEVAKPKRQFHRVEATCPICGKVAVEKSFTVMNGNRWTKLTCGHLVKTATIQSTAVDYSTWTNQSGSKTIFPFQVEGIKFIEASGGRALIADEPGLGKTIQALMFAYFHKKEVCPVLWVCKSTLKLQAMREALDWCGPEFMGQIIQNARSFILPNLKLYIISMDLLRNMPSAKLDAIGYKTVVADEIQHFKNPDSARTAELRKLVSKAECFIPLSGTPWKNRSSEYFPVLNMLDPIRFSSLDRYKSSWVDYYTDSYGKVREGGIRNIPKFREYTKDMVIRRMRDDVLPDLPKINRQIRFIDMEDMYKDAYDKAEEKVAELIKAAMIDGIPYKNVASMIMQLKHITGLAKVQVCLEDVEEFLENTDESEKLTIFHHHIDVGNNLQNGDDIHYTGIDKWLKENGLNESLRLYGGRSPEERNKVIEEFKNNPKCRVLIASTLASGEGLNIQFCQNAIQLERQWNPGNEEQAELRFSRPLTFEDYPPYLQAHLFKADKSPKLVRVTVPYMIADGTVDSILTEIVERKRIAFRKTMNDKDANINWEENEIIKEVAEYLVRKHFKNYQRTQEASASA